MEEAEEGRKANKASCHVRVTLEFGGGYLAACAKRVAGNVKRQGEIGDCPGFPRVSHGGFYQSPVTGWTYWANYNQYPTNVAAGNDDAHVGDEDNDPYRAPFIGKLRSRDLGKAAIRWAEGQVGDTIELRRHFRDFARLEIAGKWYKISDFFEWRLHLKLRKASEAADGQNYNADDDQVDVLWIDNGSNFGNDNDGF